MILAWDTAGIRIQSQPRTVCSTGKFNAQSNRQQPGRNRSTINAC
jgi:hypothetical protein